MPESAPKMLYGLKINEHTLEEKCVNVEDLINMLGITDCTYAVGFDTKLSVSAKPHYHIHWSDTRSLEALRKHKGRVMKAYGKDCKLYPAKKLEGSDFYVWYGYAVKEEFKLCSHDIDLPRLKVEAAVQAKVKQDKIKYEKKKEITRTQAADFVDKLYEILDTHYGAEDAQPQDWLWWADKVFSHSYYELDKFLTKTPLEITTWKYLLKRKLFKTEQYLQWCFPHSYR